MLDELLQLEPFSLEKNKKDKLLNPIFKKLTQNHYINCLPYKKILDIQNINPLDNNVLTNYLDIPPLPVRLFKKYDLHSVDKKDIIKTMTSSGTSGQQVSKIYLDKTTATYQTKVLAKILSDFIGSKRVPMLIIDSKSILKNRKQFSARGAGILGFSLFGRDVTYALDENMNIDFEVIENFCKKHENENIFVFGFTSIIWEHLIVPLEKEKKQLNITNGIMLHGGGWKKLQTQAVDNESYKSRVSKSLGLSKIYNYYGMIEQTGSIFMECEEGHFHCSNFSDISILDKNLQKCQIGEKGLIQLFSVIPQSYPGHNLLSEDYGELLGIDDCKCGRKGKYFTVHGRIKQAEIRGCSDTYEKN